ncbi:MAG: response regulator [Eubacteriales bacterium]
MYKVYIVDNDPFILDEIVQNIAWMDNGFEVVSYSVSPKQAIEDIIKLQPDVVFSDLKMPGMDGVEMIQVLQEAKIECEFVMLSAFANFEDSRRFFRLDGFDYLLKPVQEQEVQMVLEKLAGKLSKKKRRELGDIENISLAFGELVTYINKNFNQKHTLELLGMRFGLNPNYICNLFTKHYNTTLTRYLTQLRMDHALYMMQTTEKAYKEIAVECGYTDYYYFCKVFKGFYGASPSNYIVKE